MGELWYCITDSAGYRYWPQLQFSVRGFRLDRPFYRKRYWCNVDSLATNCEMIPKLYCKWFEFFFFRPRPSCLWIRFFDRDSVENNCLKEIARFTVPNGLGMVSGWPLGAFGPGNGPTKPSVIWESRTALRPVAAAFPMFPALGFALEFQWKVSQFFVLYYTKLDPDSRRGRKYAYHRLPRASLSAAGP